MSRDDQLQAILADKSWRGEHLIRAPERTEPPTTPVERGENGTTYCRVPGCGSELSSATRSGVCRAHNHHIDYCGCQACVRRRAAAADQAARSRKARTEVKPRKRWRP